MATPAFVRTAAYGHGSSTTSVTAPVSAATAGGNALLVVIKGGSGLFTNGCTDSKGNSYNQLFTSGSSAATITTYLAVNTTALSTSDTVTVTSASSGGWYVNVHEYSGVGVSLDGSSGGQNTGSVNTTGSHSLTSANDGDLLVSIVVTGTAYTTITPPTGWNNRPDPDTGFTYIGFADQLGPAAGTYSATWTWNNNTNQAWLMFALRAAVGGNPGSGAGTVSIAGGASAGLAPQASTGAGAVDVTGSSSAGIGPQADTAAGSVSVAGSATGVGPTGNPDTGAGAVSVAGSGSAGLAPKAATAAGTVSITSSASTGSPASGGGAVSIVASGTDARGPTPATANGSVVATGSAGAGLAPKADTAAGAVTVTGLAQTAGTPQPGSGGGLISVAAQATAGFLPILKKLWNRLRITTTLSLSSGSGSSVTYHANDTVEYDDPWYPLVNATLQSGNPGVTDTGVPSVRSYP